MKRKILCLLLSLALLCSLLPIPAAFAAQTIDKVDLTVVKPVVGKTPTFAKVDTDQYFSEKYGTVSNCSNGVTWTNQESGVNLTVNNPFKADTKYRVTYYLTAKDGYEFTASTVCTINGTDAVLELTDQSHAKVSLSDLVPGYGNKTLIDKVDLTVVKPVVGKTPTFAKVDTDQYFSEKYGTVSNCSNGVTWTNQESGVNLTVNNPFKADTKYRVTYYLTAKDGYVFTASTACTINGTAAVLELTDQSHAKVSLSDLVPDYGNKTLIDKVDLTVVKPVVGKTPTFAKVDTDQYFSEKYGTVSNCSNGVTWTNQESGVNLTVNNPFKADTKYRVTYYLTAKDGYVFTASTACTINGTVAAIELTDQSHAKVSLSDLVPGDGSTPAECDGGESCPSGKFVDINAKAWYHLSVDYAVKNGLFGGTSANTFEPETAMTRAMLVTVLWRYEGQPKGYENTFTDVNAKSGNWYIDAVAWAASNGIVNGVGNNRFDPNGKITREQMAAILFRYAQKKGINTDKRGDLSAFPDGSKVESWAKEAMQWAVAEKIIGGSDGKLLPQGNATRAQVATILMRYIENIVNK